MTPLSRGDDGADEANPQGKVLNIAGGPRNAGIEERAQHEFEDREQRHRKQRHRYQDVLGLRAEARKASNTPGIHGRCSRS